MRVVECTENKKAKTGSYITQRLTGRPHYQSANNLFVSADERVHQQSASSERSGSPRVLHAAGKLEGTIWYLGHRVIYEFG